ncbi:PRC-barrel domain-containing protein [Amycolatopsis thermophila]|uniref:Sporulation protein YlmC with PRC-barrel domain n=1 Tax=Amycolatopsis thermophila TaxID=206084 RepID=A0ABU0EZF6_9PSEU|nr:PRC-barrel domain-containing protein [Amycolatopsis thermophila]MDQ0380701.1 sporulation protein YlmC with PRC-barrel domain [Amycolatopsis thermophila]
MPADDVVRASELLGRRVYDERGRRLGKVTDLITRLDSLGQEQTVAVLVTPGRRGRLLGYERSSQRGPWLLAWLAAVLHRGTREVPWSEVRWNP